MERLGPSRHRSVLARSIDDPLPVKKGLCFLISTSKRMLGWMILRLLSLQPMFLRQSGRLVRRFETNAAKPKNALRPSPDTKLKRSGPAHSMSRFTIAIRYSDHEYTAVKAQSISLGFTHLGGQITENGNAEQPRTFNDLEKLANHTQIAHA